MIGCHSFVMQTNDVLKAVISKLIVMYYNMRLRLSKHKLSNFKYQFANFGQFKVIGENHFK